MIRSRFWLPALIALWMSIPASAGDGPSILYPSDLTLVADNTVALLAFRGGSGEDPVPVTVNGIEKDPMEGESFLSGRVDLYLGNNVINVGGTRVRVYSFPGTTMSQYKVPSATEGKILFFRSYRLHPALEDGCEGCHMVKEGKLGTMMVKDSCYSCHDNFEKGGEDGRKWYVHTPVADGECTSCHEPHFSARPKLLKKDRICFECHDPFPEEGTVHIPVKYGECTACHSPHAGPAPKQLRRVGNALCLGCHETPHRQHRSAEVKGTLTAIPPDFPVEGGELSCLGCHRPHQSSERRLFRRKQGEMCQTCHRV